MAGFAKGFNLCFDYVLYDISYTNMIMFSAVLPTYDRKTDGKKDKEQDIIKADDPKNRDKVREFFENCD